MNLSFLLDYVPILSSNSKSAFIIYCLYQRFKTDKGLVSISYKDFEEHYGFQTTTVKGANSLLSELGLISEVYVEEERTVFQKLIFRVNEIPKITAEKGQELFAKYGLIYHSDFREKHSKPPKQYEKLYDKNSLEQAYDKLGKDIFNIRPLARYLGLDANAAINYMFNEDFKNKVEQARIEVVGEEQAKEIIPKQLRKRKEAFITQLENSFKDLMNCHIKGGITLTRKDWNTHQLLRYFVVLYQQAYQVEYKFTGQPFASKEAKDIAEIYRAFNENGETVSSYIEYAFDAKVKVLERPLGTGLLKHPNMINEYEAKKSKAGKIYQRKIKGTDPIDPSFIEWINENVPDALLEVPFKTLRDLHWAKESVLEGTASRNVKEVIEEAELRNLLPNGNENLKFNEKKG